MEGDERGYNREVITKGVQTILREGQEGGRENKGGWWDEECRRGKKEVRRN